MVIVTNPATGRKDTIPITNVQFVTDGVVEETTPLVKVDEPGVTVTVGTPIPVANGVTAFSRKEGEHSSTPVKEIIVTNLNDMTQGDISRIARQVPGLGKVTLGKILDNRPAEGYADMEHLRSINGHDLPNVRWTVIEPYFTF